MYKSSNLWRESAIALRSQLYHKYWQLTPYEKAWLIATMETEDEIKLVIDEFGGGDDEE